MSREKDVLYPSIDSNIWKLAANNIQDLLEKLVEAGADLNQKDEQSCAPLVR
jgi:hypothetical protein